MQNDGALIFYLCFKSYENHKCREVDMFRKHTTEQLCQFVYEVGINDSLGIDDAA